MTAVSVIWTRKTNAHKILMGNLLISINLEDREVCGRKMLVYFIYLWFI
jgi:hypothetical protein